MTERSPKSRFAWSISLTMEIFGLAFLFLIAGLAVIAYTTEDLVRGMAADLSADRRRQETVYAQQLVLDKSLHLNEVFAGIERMVNFQANYAERLINQRAVFDAFPIYASDDFLSPGSRPRDYAMEAGKDRHVSLGSVVYKLAPGVSLGDVRTSLVRYAGLGSVLRDLYSSNHVTEWLYIGTADGVYMGYPANAIEGDYDPRTRPWFVGAREKQGGVFWSKPYEDVSGGKLVTCSRAIYGPGNRLMAVVAADVTFTELGRLASSVRAGLSGTAFLVDEKGGVVSSPPVSPGSHAEMSIFELPDLLHAPSEELRRGAAQMVAGENGVLRYTHDGAELYLAFAPVETTGWSLGVLIPLEQVLAAATVQTEARVQDLKRRLWSAGVMSITIFLAMVAAGGYFRFSRPVNDLIRNLAVIRRGDLDHRVEITSPAEFRNLSAAINQMTANLKRSREAIENYSQELERAVGERTAELTKSNRELEHALRQVREAQARMIQTEKMASVGQLVAGIAHEINNPVNFIINAVGPLRDSIEELDRLIAEKQIPDAEGYVSEHLADMRKALTLIKTGSTRTEQIVLSLRNFSRVDEDHMKLVDIHEGIDGGLSLLNYLIKGRIRVKKQYGDIGPVECHPGQINQVFMNILANACQAIPGDGEITIRTSREGDEVTVAISDTGPGIDLKVLDKIFDPFFTTKAPGEGTGLGLSISHGIVERHGGHIEVQTEVGRGTTFLVRIPALHPSPTQPKSNVDRARGV